MIVTPRLRLRPWQRQDLHDFSRMNADPHVMKYFPDIYSQQKSVKAMAVLQSHIDRHGFGFWAAEKIDTQEFVGMIGLHKPPYTLPFSPCIEIGWRFRKNHWGKGYAIEAGERVLDYAFNSLLLDEVVAFTVASNSRSEKVMQRLGMTRSASDFNHPLVDSGSPLSSHLLYRISKN